MNAPVTAMGTFHPLDDDDLLTWARRTRHWYANERNDHARECAAEARFAARRRAELRRERPAAT